MALTAQYIETPVSKPKSKNVEKTARNQAIRAVNELGTPTLIWEVCKRHKFGIVVLALIAENAYMFARYFAII